MPTLSWASKAAISLIWCNKDRLCINQNLPIDKLLTDFQSNPDFLLPTKEKLVKNILEDISKKYDSKYFETVQLYYININYLHKKDEEKCFFEQMKDKEAPLILLKRLSEDIPYSYFENNNGTVYLLTALFTENAQKRLYCNFENQWKNLSENPKDKTPIKFSEGTVYVYTKIKKEDLDKEKVNKRLPSEWEGRKKDAEKLPEAITAYSVGKNKKFDEKDIDFKPKINYEDQLKDFKNEIDKFKAEKEKENKEIQKNLNEKIQSLENENKKLKDYYIKILNVETDKMNEISKELQKSVSIQQELSQNIKNKEEVIEDYKNQLLCLEELLKENESLIKENQVYKIQNDALNQENQDLKSQIKELKKNLKNKDDPLPLPSPIPRPPPPSPSLIFNQVKSGIPNIGNTCYLNSLLQVLASNNEFCEKIETIEYELFSALSSLILSIRNPGSCNTERLVRSFKSQLVTEFPWLGNSTQEDSKEVMMMLTGRLSELTDIKSIFTTEYKQAFKCHICKNKTNGIEPNNFINVPKGKFRSIQEFLPSLRESKYFTDKNQLYCQNCKKTQNITMECEEISWPSTVTFYLPSNNGRIIINEELNIEGTIYRWYGLICHYGTPYSGHYKAYTWDTKKWTEYNDSWVSTNAKVDVTNGYLAFYASYKI